MKAFIMPNLDKKNAVECATKVIKKLIEFGIESSMDLRYSDCFHGVSFVPFYDGISVADVVIAIGGDGTFIHSAKHACVYDKPLLGINVGRLGFLAGLEMSELDRLALLTKDYSEERRMMLTCVHFDGDGNVKREHLALNDVVVSNGAVSRIIELDLGCNGKYFTSYRADGVILATPTGSTAYALSAGGPVLEPSLNSIAISPICPHTLVARTIIFSEEKVITVAPSGDNLHPIYVTIDGEQGNILEQSDNLEVRKSADFARLINLNEKSFYEILNQKFNIMQASGRYNGGRI